MSSLKQQIETLLGCDSGICLDDVWAPGLWLRVQPACLGLEHKSETSGGGLAEGVHVHQTLGQAYSQEGRWLFLQEGGYELIVIRGPNALADTGDVEGWVLPPGQGEIIGRFDYTQLCEELGED